MPGHGCGLRDWLHGGRRDDTVDELRRECEAALRAALGIALDAPISERYYAFRAAFAGGSEQTPAAASLEIIPELGLELQRLPRERRASALQSAPRWQESLAGQVLQPLTLLLPGTYLHVRDSTPQT